MSDGVDALVHAPQAPIAEPALDAPAIDAGREQLLSGDAAVLAGRDVRGRVEEGSHVEP